MLHHSLPRWDIVVFDPAIDIGNAREDPDLFLDNHPAPLVLDEIQFAPELVPAIKRRDSRGITAFRETYPQLEVVPGLIICPTERVGRLNDTDFALPWDSG